VQDGNLSPKGSKARFQFVPKVNGVDGGSGMVATGRRQFLPQRFVALGCAVQLDQVGVVLPYGDPALAELVPDPKKKPADDLGGGGRGLPSSIARTNNKKALNKFKLKLEN
jgi:hypothetical protein